MKEGFFAIYFIIKIPRTQSTRRANEICHLQIPFIPVHIGSSHLAKPCKVVVKSSKHTVVWVVSLRSMTTPDIIIFTSFGIETFKNISLSHIQYFFFSFHLLAPLVSRRLDSRTRVSGRWRLVPLPTSHRPMEHALNPIE